MDIDCESATAAWGLRHYPNFQAISCSRANSYMEKHNSCINSRAIIQYIEENAPDKLEDLLRDLGPEMGAVEDKREFLTNPNNWISSELLIALFQRAKTLLNDPEAPFKIGCNSILKRHLGYIQRIIIYAFGNPNRIMARIQKVNDHFNRTKTIELVDRTPTSSVVRLHWKRDIELSRDFCSFNKGIYQALPAIWGLPSARLEETSCFFNGDQYCEYHISWEKQNRFKTLLFNTIAPWRLLNETIKELEQDKEVLRQKYNKIHELNLKLENKVAQLTTLQESSAAILSTIDLKELLDLILSRLAKVANLDRAGIFLKDEKTQQLELIHAVGVNAHELARLKGYHIPMDKMDNIIARSAHNTEPVIVEDVSHLALNPNNLLLSSLNPRAFILVPLKARGRTVGIMLGDNSSDKNFTRTIDKEFLKNFANHIAMALDNATLYARLQESEQKYREIVENVNEGIWMLGEDATIQYANQHLKEMLGMKELRGTNVYMLLDSENKKILLKILLENLLGRVDRQELQLTTSDGEKKSVLLSSVPIYADHEYSGSLAIITDLTEQKNMERQLLQIQKLESIGTMAGGIAHDFNNILTGILGYTSMLQHEMEGNPKWRHYVNIIEKSSLRAADLVKKMLAFSRDSSQCETEIVNIKGVITESITLLQSSLPKDITVNLHIEGDMPNLECSATQIQQTVLNLCLNARDAMPEGGTLTVEVNCVSGSNLKDLLRGLEINANQYIRIAVTDTGLGIDPATRERIFDPFFTTKEVGKGSGLGLAMVYGIVKGMDGHILVHSEVGQGTTFELLLPIKERRKDGIFDTDHGVKTIVGSETVLVADDEEIIRDLAKEVLVKLGYKVLLAQNGKEAVEIYRAFGSSIDMAILDMVMPGMSGIETYHKLCEINPHIKVLFCGSRASAETEIENDPFLSGKPFTPKPFNLEEFPRKIREILDT